ncbi:MAG TPA: photosynthetic reaction center cytochrome c subunit family protein [Bryobacteraceae bacterium]|nr:photosynthetic reaction center cytochrome c subunit family protein [Bryobacteraceae bacterium]
MTEGTSIRRWSGLPDIALAAAICIICASPAPAQNAGSQKQLSDQVFKNVQVLKGIPVDDFLGTMGVMSAALGYDCSECHTNAGTDKVDWAADTQKKVMARKMVVMMRSINQQNFSGRQMVTCWSCHHGRDRPSTTMSMETVYGPANMETDDMLTQMPGQPQAQVIIDKYLKALGGAEKLEAIKSYVGQGTSVGFGGFGGGGHVQIYAKFPDQRATYIEFAESTGRGDSIRTCNGTTAWIMTPLTILGRYEVTGGELDGAKLDAELGFPAQIPKVLTNLRVSLPITISDLPGPESQTGQQAAGAGIGKDRLVNVVQGTGPNGVLATMYFDQETGLLMRVVRLERGPIGRVPTSVDYSDYRDVNGVKMPFRITFAWLDGRDALQLDQIQTNVPIDEAKFGKPVSSKEK